jgi:hypothetical protein
LLWKAFVCAAPRCALLNEPLCTALPLKCVALPPMRAAEKLLAPRLLPPKWAGLPLK